LFRVFIRGEYFGFNCNKVRVATVTLTASLRLCHSYANRASSWGDSLYIEGGNHQVTSGILSAAVRPVTSSLAYPDPTHKEESGLLAVGSMRKPMIGSDWVTNGLR